MDSDEDGRSTVSADVVVQLAGLSTVRAIARIALPAIILNAAPPITVAVQTALIGSYAPTSALAAFAAVGTSVGFICRVFNFLVDGVSSKVGRCVGQRAWRRLATHVQLSMRWSLALGAAAVPLLLAVRGPLCSWLLALSEEVQQEAAAYWVLRSLLVPVQLVNMAAAGILQGFGRVRVNAALTSTAAVLEMLGSAAVLRLRQQHLSPAGDSGTSLSSLSSTIGSSISSSGSISSSSSLVALGCVTAGCALLLAIGSLACILALPPVEAKGQVNLLREVFGSSRSASSGSGGSVHVGAAAAGPEQPLLAQREGEEGGQPAVVALPASGAGSRIFDEATREFLRDGAHMFVRSMILQLTFFLALAAAARLGTAALAAHSIVGQLWVVISYAVDGFAAAGIVLGSRLYGFARDPQRRAEAKRHMQRLTHRVLLAGGVSGLAAGLAFHLARDSLIALFTADPEVAAVLRQGAWVVLAVAQPLNGLLFVYDGLMYATQHFKYVRDYMALGFILIFCPLLALEFWLFPGVTAIWLAKAALNVWRLLGAAYLIHRLFLPHFGTEKPEGAAAAAADPDHASALAEA